MTIRDAAQYYKISVSLFNRIREKVPLKTYGTPRRPRFHRDDLDYWMRKRFETDESIEQGNEGNKKPLKGNPKDDFDEIFKLD